MPRLRTAAAASLLVVPIIAGGFLLQEPPAGVNATLFDQVMTLVRTAYVDSVPLSATYEKAAKGLVRELNDLYSELLPPKESEDFNRATGGRYGGTGRRFQSRDRRPLWRHRDVDRQSLHERHHLVEQGRVG